MHTGGEGRPLEKRRNGHLVAQLEKKNRWPRVPEFKRGHSIFGLHMRKRGQKMTEGENPSDRRKEVGKKPPDSS